MGNIKILLVGCGYWGKNWYNTVKNSKYKLVGVVDPAPLIDVDLPLFNTLEEVNLEYTHVIIATNAKLHVGLFKKLNIPPSNILIEKPCGTNIQDAEIIKDTFPGYIFLYSDEFQYIKDNISKIGKPKYWKSIRASMGPRVRSDVSIVEDYMIHDLYMFQTLFGKSNIENINHSNDFKPPIKTSTCNLKLKSYSGVRGEFYSSWIYPDKERKIVIIGDKGSFIWENEELYFDSTHWVGDKVIEGVREKIPSTSKSNLELELEFFILSSNSGILETWELLTKINYNL